jgi:hypothetical protein
MSSLASNECSVDAYLGPKIMRLNTTKTVYMSLVCRVNYVVLHSQSCMARFVVEHNWRERRRLFFAYIHPIIVYGICCMHSGTMMRQKLEYLYRKCGRIVFGNDVSRADDSVILLLDMLPLRLLFQLRGATLMYRVLRLSILLQLALTGKRQRCSSLFATLPYLLPRIYNHIHT